MDTSLARARPKGTYENELLAAIQKFGFSSLSSNQETLIRASIEGSDVFGILPTGGGKSACFQIPGIVTKSHTLVVSPLIALQDNQVQALRAIGVKAFALHSNLADYKRMAIKYYYSRPPNDEASFLYMSPELLLTETFRNLIAPGVFGRMAVDEAHCVSTWGNSFRPDYQRIRVAVRKLGIPVCSAFTATTDPRIEADIRMRTPIKQNHLRLAVSPMRENLSLQVRHLRDMRGNLQASKYRRETLCKVLEHAEYRGAAIVYCTSVSVATTLYLRLREYKEWLRQYGYSVHLFHGQLPYDDKQSALKAFLERPRPIIIATSAFGMGIDRGDVRQVVHYQTPYTLIDYAQQIGRAGRDGLPSLCTTLHLPHEMTEQDIKQVSYEVPDYDFVERVHGWIRKISLKLSPEQRRVYDLRSFISRMQHIVDGSDQIRRKERYMDRVRSSVAILQRAGVIIESEDGLSVTAIDAGGKLFKKLIELTKMDLRMQIREHERIQEFFGKTEPTQEFLWELLAKD